MFKKGEEVKKVVILVSSPFNQRDRERFGVEILQKNGFEVKVWDFTPFLNPWRWKSFIPDGKSNFEEYYVFYTKKEAISAISELTNYCLIVCVINYSYETIFLYRAISRYRLPYCLVLYNWISYDINSHKNISKRLGNLTLRKLLEYLFLKIPYKLLGIKPVKIVLMLGGEFNLSRQPVDKTTEIIKSHYFDYDIYLKEIQKPAEFDDHMAVFLDHYLPFHPDWGTSARLDPSEYYPLLCKFFDCLDKNYGIHVVIAAHPRSAYENLPDYFNGRRIIRDKTAELVRRCKFVIAHHSASTSFAVLFRKPVIFVTTDKLKQIQLGEMTDFMASMFNKVPINLSGDFKVDLDRELMVDDDVYKKYETDYIKKEGAEAIPIWQTFANYLKNAE